MPCAHSSPSFLVLAVLFFPVVLPSDCLSPGSLGHGTQLETGSALEWEGTTMYLQQSHRHKAQVSAAPGVQARGLQYNPQQIQGMLKV